MYIVHASLIAKMHYPKRLHFGFDFFRSSSCRQSGNHVHFEIIQEASAYPLSLAFTVCPKARRISHWLFKQNFLGLLSQRPHRLATAGSFSQWSLLEVVLTHFLIPSITLQAFEAPVGSILTWIEVFAVRFAERWSELRKAIGAGLQRGVTFRMLRRSLRTMASGPCYRPASD